MVGVVNEPADSGPRSIYTNRRFTTTANAVVFCPEEFWHNLSARLRRRMQTRTGECRHEIRDSRVIRQLPPLDATRARFHS